MVTSAQCLKLFGKPLPENEHNYMAPIEIPAEIIAGLAHVRFSALGTIGFPRRIYANKKMAAPLLEALRNIIQRGLRMQVKTWDGCFMVRNMRGLSSYSLHAWGCAVDLNAPWNVLGKAPTMSPELVACFTDAGLEWGGKWSRPDGMHFQLSKL